MRKNGAFSYLELIIAMTLVVIIAILSAPLMTGMGKNPTPAYGEYRCYVRLIDGKWKLYENQRINTDTYPTEDIEVAEGESCVFVKPTGNFFTYTITLQGGGGSGSMPYFILAKSDGISLVPGQNGKAGEEKSLLDSLNFSSDGEMQIDICNQDLTKNNCVGKGGAVNKTIFSKAPYERMQSIKTNLKNKNSLTESDKNYIKNAPCDNDIVSVLDAYLNAQNSNDKKTAKSKLLKEIGTCASEIKDDSAHTGNSGQPSKITLSGNKIVIAEGGLYGISDKFSDIKTYGKDDFKSGSNNIFYLPKDANPSINSDKFKDCNGDDANNPLNTDTYENFGAEGKSGVFACKIKEWGNLNLLNENSNVRYGANNQVTSSDNECYMGYGGAGAGGAIIIQWN